MHDSDCVGGLLPDTGAEDPDLPELLRERREHLTYVSMCACVEDSWVRRCSRQHIEILDCTCLPW
jgi:hypothetical protein